MEKPWIIVQYDNRTIEKDFLTFIEINKKYCNKYGYEHILETKPYNLPPWWIKVALVKDRLDTNRYKGALWLDTDAVIHNADRSLDSLLQKDKSFYYCTSAPVWVDQFNAGVWLIKHDTRGMELMEKWIHAYSPNDWTKKDGKWTTPGEWSGPTYEQGALVKYVFPEFESSIHKYPWQVFQSNEPNPLAFTMHFAEKLKMSHMPQYMNQLYTNLWMSILYYLIVCSCIVAMIYMVRPKWFQSIRSIWNRKRWF